MNDFSEQLSAYLDGELDEAAAEAVEARLASDPAAQAELESLMQADALAQEEFQAELKAPVAFSLAQHIMDTPMQERKAPRARPIWGSLAASLLVFVLGGLGGYALKGQAPVVQTAGWLADIADYHAVYAGQNRHLVEVGAEEAAHIEAWLGNTVGSTFTIPDLSEFGLTFQGGRLLVANAKPVAQLMYRDENGAVVALCLQSSSKNLETPSALKEQEINGFDFVSWSASGADYVVIGPNGHSDLRAIATSAALDI